MRLVLRLPPSSVVVCMSENPNQGGLVRTVLGHRRGGVVRTHWKGQTPGLVKAWKCRHVLVHPVRSAYVVASHVSWITHTSERD